MCRTLHILLEDKEEKNQPIYIAGSFNNWNPHHADFRMNNFEDNLYEFTIDIPSDTKEIEYKFTRGGWENVEIDLYGNITPNRTVPIDKKEVHITVEKWRDNWAPYKEEFFPIVELISDDFEIPQLDRTRRVWALLPYDYATSDRHYPVLYLQDAQNLFNEEAIFGNWEIDKKLSILAEYGRGDIIIIAVEHGDSDRLTEYIVEANAMVEQGDGKKYIRFITDTLKPFIDKNYRTLKDRDNTGIGGSSLGGLISIYGGLLYPEVYSKLMVFSPSLWAIPKINFPNFKFYNPFDIKIYIYGGEQEGSQMVEKIQEFTKSLEKYDDDTTRNFNIKTRINPEGKHQEFFWSQEFPKAIEWLYFNTYEDPSKKKKQ